MLLQTTKTKMSGKETPTEKGEKVKYFSLNIICKLNIILFEYLVYEIR